NTLVHTGIDEYQLLAWTLDEAGALEVVRLDTAEQRWHHQLFEPGAMVSASFLNSSDTAAFGLADGSIQLADIGFRTRILNAPDLPPAVLAQLESGQPLVDLGSGVVEPTPSGQYRHQELEVVMGDKVTVSTGSITEIDHVVRTEGPFVVALTRGAHPAAAVAETETLDAEIPAADETVDAEILAAETPASGAIRMLALAWEEDTNFLTGESSLEVGEPVELPFEAETAPAFLEVDGAGTQAYLVWENGHLQRLSIRNLAAATVAEKGSLLPPGSTDRLRFFEPILGSVTYLWGDSAGNVNGGFPIRVSDAEQEIRGLFDVERASDEPMAFARTKSLASATSAATASSPSARSRLAFAGFEDGGIRLFNVTNSTEILRTSLPEKEKIVSVVMSPKEDGVLVATERSLWHG
ncbi:MAG: hypothetical protein AAF725_27950, partial [Acidobacteriota bacterium]